jgi:hypothetical protein
MQWSQLKKRFEDTFAESVQGHVEVWATRYRGAHDQAGECWITLDKERIINMADLTYYKEHYGEAQRMCELENCLDYLNPAQSEAYYRAYDLAQEHSIQNSVFHSGDAMMALAEYLNMNIDSAHASPNVLIRAFSLFDRRYGKRRLIAFEPTHEHPLVQKFYAIRCQLEGVPFTL